jgi:hypothetical protein
MMITWKSLDGLQAFEKARRMSFYRKLKNAARPRKSRDLYRGIRENERFSAAIEDIEVLEVDGEATALPALPRALKREWCKAFDRFGAEAEDDEPFAVRLQSGRLLLEGGIRELMRLELRRQAGEGTVAAIIRTYPSARIVECPGIPISRDGRKCAAC